MKARLLKRVLPLFLIAALVGAGVLVGLPGEAEAQAKVTYNVVILDTATPFDRNNPTVNNESPDVFMGSINNAPVGPDQVSSDANEGISFQMVVETKAKTEKTKVGPATYYPVTISGRTFKAPIIRYESPMGTLRTVTKMAGNAKGKLYISGGDVDVSQEMGETKLTTKIGDGIVDPVGSLIVPITVERTTIIEATGKPFFKAKLSFTWTTGSSRIQVAGSKSGLKGMALPDNDPTGLLPQPLVGESLNLEAGTGKLVATVGGMNAKTPLGQIDFLRGQVWVMKITPTGGGKNPAYAGLGVALGGGQNPAYASLIALVPAPTHRVEIEPQTLVLSPGGSAIMKVSVTSLSSQDVNGNLTVTASRYTSTSTDGLTTWSLVGPEITVATFANLTIHPEKTVSFLVPIILTLTQPTLVILKADFLLNP